MNDADRQARADEIAELATRNANALGHRDPRRIALNGQHEGDDMTPVDRMRFAFQGQPRAARYDGDSEPSAAREPMCCCGHGHDKHSPNAVDGTLGCYAAVGTSWCRCRAYEPDNVRGLNSDPTGNAGTRPDKASAKLKRFDAIQRQQLDLANEAADILAEFGPARVASDADRAALVKANVVPEPGCTNCGKHGHWQPIDPRVPKRAICGFCLAWERDTAALPGKRECDLHADGKNVRRPDTNHVSRKASA